MDWQSLGQTLSWPEDVLVWASIGVIVVALALRVVARLWLRYRPDSGIWGAALLRLASWTVLLLMLAIVGRSVPVPAPLQDFLGPALIALLIFLTARTTVQLVGVALRRQWARWWPQLPPVTLADFLVAFIVYTLAGLMILHQFGLAITPLLTALGVGGLAVALGVQDTLANLFAGLGITLARTIRPGDYLRLDNGLEGQVHDIGWRYVTLRTPQHTLVIIPNLRMGQLIITNFSLPEPRILCPIPITVTLTDAPQLLIARIEQTLLQAAQQIPDALLDPPPRCRIVGVTDKGMLQLQLELWLRTPQAYHKAIHTVYQHLCEAGFHCRA
jgi:small-conductance mechanosensitive channel